MASKLLDPTGASERAVDTTLTPRLGSLRGLTAGLLDNAKRTPGCSSPAPDWSSSAPTASGSS
jgi:hypothetical protein